MEGERDEQDLEADCVRERERREAGEYLVLVNEPGVRSPFELYNDRSCGCTSTSSRSNDALNVESMRGKANADSKDETLLRGWMLCDNLSNVVTLEERISLTSSLTAGLGKLS